MKNITLIITICLLASFAYAQENIREVSTPALPKYKADLDTQFNKGSAIASIPLNARAIDDLFILGRVWGFVKYYHPALYAGDYNWDYELFRVLPKIIHCKGNKERNEILFTWITQLGAFTTDKIKLPDSADVKIYPDIQWIDDKAVLGDRLPALLNDIRNAQRNSTGYYLQVARAHNPDLKNEKAYAGMRFPDAGFRLLTLYRYWNIIQYLFPYKNLIKENWNDVLREFIPKFLNPGNELGYKLTVLALIARIHDTHANIWSNDAAIENYRGNNYAPLEIRFVENKAVVTDYLHKELGPKTGLQKGDIIVSINGKSTDSLVKEKLPFTPASNYPTQLRDIAMHLLRTGDTVLNITYQHGNTIHSTSLACYQKATFNLYQKYKRRDTCFKYLTPDIAYIYPGTIRRAWLPDVMPGFLKTKGMIIDMRCSLSDDIYPVLAKYLLPEPTRFARITNAYTPFPGLFAFTSYAATGTRNQDYYKGRIVIIVNELTQSAAEFTSMALRVAPHATVIGSTTAGADGNVSRFFLPGGITTMISGIGIYYPDGRETQRVGIIPDQTVQPTIQGIIQDRDELLEKAIAIINENNQIP
jgi:hypothetical protein